jgi:8-oxo-dGTP pyrophosphatase MutT (NUDIX family)
MVSTVREIKTIECRPDVYKSRFISVANDSVEFPNGVEGTYNVVSMGEAKGALIVPIAFRRGIPYFGLVNQYRYPIKSESVEFPRGGADKISPEGAEVEVYEELGQSSKRLDLIGTLHPDTGILSTEVGIWIALMDESVLDLDHEEKITGLRPTWVSEDSFISMIFNGKINCSLTLAAYTMFNVNRNKYGMFMR